MQCNNKKCFLGAMLLLGWMAILSTVCADPATGQAGIEAFAKCSRQCVAENQQCRKQLEKQCSGHDEDCYESCTVAYPLCMAGCAKPGS